MKKIVVLATAGIVALGVGCHSNAVDPGAFKSALNSYYSAAPVCVWSSPVKFPAQADASNEEQTKGFDALTDAGMLTRTPAEKKRFLIGSTITICRTRGGRPGRQIRRSRGTGIFASGIQK
jgi:hypothetical protein